ncbi:MAG: sulfotransferase [Chloroflexi bacterium]|nr:sulfotransferase [Chloroflexota bacterium]
MTEERFPDFIIGGAPRAGTTWLYHLLDRHPEVYMAKPASPEPKFFLVDKVYELGMRHYSRTWFSDIGGARVAGEKSTNYLENAVAAERIHRHLPGVKLVFILREPASRAFSNYLWSRMNGLEHEDFATALALEEQREQELPEHLRYARPHAYFSRGLYADLLQPYFDLFRREHILCLRYEDIVEKPAALAERLHLFLKVEPRPEDSKDLGVINPSEKDGYTMSKEIRRMLWARYAEPNRRLAQFLGPEFEIWETQ